MDTYSLKDVSDGLADVWDKLNRRQKISIANLISSAKERNEKVLENQISFDDYTGSENFK